MRDLESADVMLRSAGRDLQALRHMLDQAAFPVEVFGFHAQQVVEKSLKAWLSLQGVLYQKTHNIRHLILLLETSGADISGLWDFANLHGFAVQFRYEAFEMAEEQLDREKVVQQVANLHQRVVNLREVNSLI